jgi:hypothetical protein
MLTYQFQSASKLGLIRTLGSIFWQTAGCWSRIKYHAKVALESPLKKFEEGESWQLNRPRNSTKVTSTICNPPSTINHAEPMQTERSLMQQVGNISHLPHNTLPERKKPSMCRLLLPSKQVTAAIVHTEKTI